MTIGIDADGVIFDYVRTCADVVNSHNDYSHPLASYESAHDFDILKIWGVPHLKQYVDYHFDRRDHVYNIPVIPGALEFIEELRRITDNDFVIITACPASWHKQREAALRDYFGIDKKLINFSYNKKLFRLKAHIDDWHQNLDGMEGWRILLDRPWNQNTEGVACDRAYTFGECLAKVNRILLWNK